VYPRVAAIDDVEEHLFKIVRGLGRAGFSVLPFLFEDGRLEDGPPAPLHGVRMVFTDIHLVGGGPSNEKVHAANIVRCLKAIVAPGPYVVVFWSEFPEDSERIAALIDRNAEDAGLVPPIGYTSIDKKSVFAVSGGASGDFDSARLRDRVLEEIAKFETLSLILSWEERVEKAAAMTTNGLYALTNGGARRVEVWERLLAFLACEAAGASQAKEDVVAALDEALLPLLEDRLARLPGRTVSFSGDGPVGKQIHAIDGVDRPSEVSAAQLNAGYLVDEANIDDQSLVWERGMVTRLGGAFINSGEFIRAFGVDRDDLIKREFVLEPRKLSTEQCDELKLHVLALDAECDHVQGKVSTRRYLLSLLVPEALQGICLQKSGAGKGKNDSVMDVGLFSLRQLDGANVRLLVSCRSFLALAPDVRLDGSCRFRVRRAVIGEIMHRYAAHAGRPGVMRFR
jgi:hypothetical protein